MKIDEQSRWTVVGPPSVFAPANGRDTVSLGELPTAISMIDEADLELRVPQRSFRSPNLSKWVDCVLAGDVQGAAAESMKLNQYPIALTRDCASAKMWLRKNGRGERRYGLLASSGARRLRADGFGIFLNASAGNDIANWYLNEPGDIRSSYALEVPANEYACQGLELDFICLCWGGDLLWDSTNRKWRTARLSGTGWQRVENDNGRRFLLNSYRVLLTRAREGLLLWVPNGSESDATRPSTAFNATAKLLVQCGATDLDI